MIDLSGLVHLILPVHNRREITLRCLRHLRDTGVDARARVVVVDDGSTDGTGDAVREEFPAVTVLQGDGDLYWTGAIVMGMRHAVAGGTACCVWLNDDSHPVPGAVEQVVQRAVRDRCVVAGLGRLVAGAAARDFQALRQTRRGWSSRVEAPSADGLIDVDACRGNLVAVPREIIDAIGYPDEVHLPQYFADTDYTLRATRAGFRCAVDPQAVVEERVLSGSLDESWLTTQVPLGQIWARFRRKGSSMYWRANWVFWRRHWGPWRGAWLFAAPYVRLALISVLRLLPLAWRRRWRDG